MIVLSTVPGLRIGHQFRHMIVLSIIITLSFIAVDSPVTGSSRDDPIQACQSHYYCRWSIVFLPTKHPLIALLQDQITRSVEQRPYRICIPSLAIIHRAPAVKARVYRQGDWRI